MTDTVPTPTGGVHKLTSYSRFDLFRRLRHQQDRVAPARRE
ncbi:MAG: hypothetical protein WDM92_03370 [Caulobacteraceae bacterium]